MTSERRTCKSPECHQKFTRPQGSRRIFCETCRPSKVRPVDPPPLDEDVEPGPIESAARLELEEAGQASTTEGLLFLRLAREVDARRATGSGLAALADRLLKAKAVALAGPESMGDAVDELRARRQVKVVGS